MSQVVFYADPAASLFRPIHQTEDLKKALVFPPVDTRLHSVTPNRSLLDAMTLEQIKAAVRNGQTVYWKSHIYPVTMTKMQNGKERWLIECKENDSRVGLTWQDGKTMNGEEKDFHTAPYPNPHSTE